MAYKFTKGEMAPFFAQLRLFINLVEVCDEVIC